MHRLTTRIPDRYHVRRSRTHGTSGRARSCTSEGSSVLLPVHGRRSDHSRILRRLPTRARFVRTGYGGICTSAVVDPDERDTSGATDKRVADAWPEIRPAHDGRRRDHLFAFRAGCAPGPRRQRAAIGNASARVRRPRDLLGVPEVRGAPAHLGEDALRAGPLGTIEHEVHRRSSPPAQEDGDVVDELRRLGPASRVSVTVDPRSARPGRARLQDESSIDRQTNQMTEAARFVRVLAASAGEVVDHLG